MKERARRSTDSEQGSRMSKRREEDTSSSSVALRYNIKAEARLPEVIKERVMMATTRGARRINDYRFSSL
jgi:hypothetical protein